MSASRRPKDPGFRLLSETPVITSKEGIVEQLKGWLKESKLKEHGPHVGAILGGRGSGKTSVLQTVGAWAIEQRWAVAVNADDKPVLFDPSELAIHTSVEFALTRYLRQVRLAAETASNDMNELDNAEADWMAALQPDRYLDLLKEDAPSAKQLLPRLREGQATIELAHCAAREKINQWCKKVQSNHNILLLVDDIDLHPERILQIFELIYYYFQHPSVHVLISGAQAEIHAALEHALQRQNRAAAARTSGLAQAFLDKWMPVRWHINDLPVSKRWDFLVSVLGADGQKPHLTSRPAFPLSDGELTPDRKKHLQDTLPGNYRLLKQVHNACVRERSDSDRQERQSILKDMFNIVDESAQDIFWSGLLAADIRVPEQKLRETFFSQPEHLRSCLDGWRPTANAHHSDPRSVHPLPADFVTAKITNVTLAALGQLWGTLLERRHVVAISGDGDALALFRGAVEEPFEIYLPDGRSDTAEALSLLTDGLKSVKAQLPLSTHLTLAIRAAQAYGILAGFELRFYRKLDIQAGPDEVIVAPSEFLRDTPLKHLQLVPAVDAGASEVVLGLDLLGRMTDAQLADIDAAPDGPRYILKRLAAGRLSPTNYEPLVAETLNVLRRLKNEGVNKVHLALAGPIPFAVILGHQLQQQAPLIELYEFDRGQGTYRHFFPLQQPDPDENNHGQP